jgi:hypothetical protein
LLIVKKPDVIQKNELYFCNQACAGLCNQEVRVSERQTKGQPPDRFKPQANIVRDHEEPKNRMEALSGVDKHDWIRAMNDQMKALTENSTWVLTTLPEGRKTMGI